MRHLRTTSASGAIAFVGVIALLLAGCGGMASASQRNVSGGNATSGNALPALNIRLEVERYAYTTPASMCSAPLVALVTVGGRGQARWNTTNGARPANATEESVVQQGYAIYTPAIFATMTVLVDHRTQPTATFVTLGGQVGDDRYVAYGYPTVARGVRYVVVFAPTVLPVTHAVTESMLLVYDAFPVTPAGKVILQPAGSAQEPGPGQPQPEIALPVSQLTQQFAACT